MTQKQINPIALEKMLNELAVNNWAQSPDIFTSEFCHSLALECQNKHAAGLLKSASIGHGASKMKKTELRGDFTHWLDEKNSTAIEQEFLLSMGDLLKTLNHFFYLGLKRFESHFALYPPGAGYVKHVDNHFGTGARKITFILYLNADWKSGHGGELSIFDPENSENKIAEVAPRLGTFVLFRSDLFPHQVEKSFQARKSVTGWFRDDAS